MKKILFLLFSSMLGACITYAQQQNTIYVSPSGNDAYSGTLAKPYKTIGAALQHLSTIKEKNVHIFLRQGKYHPDTTIVITTALLAGHSLTLSAYENEEVIISGARKIKPAWKAYKDGILQAFIGKGLKPDVLYCNGKSLNMARYPNYDSAARVFNGTAADAISPARVTKWSNPVGGYVHALHSGEWGSLHYHIEGVNADTLLQLAGGWQHNRPDPMNKEYRFVENIFEELDAPNEWYYNAEEGVLYLYSSSNLNLSTAVFEYSFLDELVVIKGSTDAPVKNVTINGICFTGTNRTFMLTREPLLRSDWAIYRGGAVLLDGTEHINIANCHFEELGGNAIFLSNYNRSNTIAGNEIDNIGANAIAFVGNANAVRSPSFKYGQFVAVTAMDMRRGPKSNDYPVNCTAYNNLIHDIGKIEKQVAGVEIDMASAITVSHNTIYNVPRSGINIGDGCWGGHMIEYNDVFNTVLETGDHGAFNSWGRDRYWLPGIEDVDSLTDQFPALPFLDVVKTITIRNNRFYCAHGWDIDLDDGSTNYHIYNNLCLNGGLKLREGFGRVVENNILINNSFHPHVWYKKSGDIFRHNIVGASYAPIGIKVWGRQVDSNFFMLKAFLDAAQKNSIDKNSAYGNPAFTNLSSNNYTVSNAAAFNIGFKNFSMSQFGVVSPALKSKAAKAPVPGLKLLSALKKGETVKWLGADIKNIEGLGERSAAGLFDENGVLVLKVTDGSLAAKSGLKERDVILMIDNKPVGTVAEFLTAIQVVTWQGSISATIMRDQKERAITLLLK